MALFRKEAEDFSAQQLGHVVVLTPTSHVAAGMFALAICVAALLFLFTAHYARREQVSGHLVASTGEARIASRRSATVTKIFVRERQHVKKGDPLLQLSNEITTADGGVHASIQRGIEQQISEVDSSIDATTATLSSDRLQLRERVSSLSIQLHDLQQQIAYQEATSSQKQHSLSKLKPLLKEGFVAEYQIQDLETGLLDSQSQTASLRRQFEETSQQQRESRRKLATLDDETLLRLNELRRERARLQASLTQDRSDLEIIVRAETDATVSSLLVQKASVVDPGQALLALIPEPSTLVAEVFIPSSAIGFVHPGTRVALHYAAYPYQKYGVQYAVVDHVSESPVLPTQLAGLLGQAAPTQPLYRATATLERQHINVGGVAKALNPGMQVEAALLLEDHSIASWLLEPVTAVRASIEG
jgi:membrane fusion protein